MEDQAPYGDNSFDHLLAPYARVLESEGFVVEQPRPFGAFGVSADWPASEGHYFWAQAQVIEDKYCVSLSETTAGRCEPLVAWLRLDAPQELWWLLQRNLKLAVARTAARQAAQPHFCHATLPCTSMTEKQKCYHLLGEVCEDMPSSAVDTAIRAGYEQEHRSASTRLH